MILILPITAIDKSIYHLGNQYFLLDQSDLTINIYEISSIVERLKGFVGPFSILSDSCLYFGFGFVIVMYAKTCGNLYLHVF